jgi:hypothetical protein
MLVSIYSFLNHILTSFTVSNRQNNNLILFNEINYFVWKPFNKIFSRFFIFCPKNFRIFFNKS